MKKKVFFIMSTDDFSGAELVNFNIINGLKDDYEFYWVSKKGKICEYLKEKNIKWIEISELTIKELKRIVKDYEPDILHATDYKASFLCAIINNKKIKKIAHIHNNSPWLKKIGIKSMIFLYTYLKMDKVIAVSNSIKEEFVFSKVLKDKYMCIGNPIDRKYILEKIQKDNIDRKKIYDICCVARITEQKNPLKFIEIVYELKKYKNTIKAIWVGQGELLDKCNKRVKELNLDDNISFVGFKKNPYEYMDKSKVFILTSEWEGYGLVAFEALTLGLPTYVSNVGGLKDIVDNKCGKLCDNKSDFLQCLDVLNDDEAYKKKSYNATKRSKEIENYKEYINKINYIYKELI